MTTATAAQRRFFGNVVLIAARRLLFDAMRRYFPCPELAEIVTIHNGQGLRATDRDEEGQYTVYAAGGPVGRHRARLTEKPFVVIGRKGSAGKPTYAPNGGWVIDTAYYTEPNDVQELRCEFLFHAISSLDFTADIISTAIPGINRTSIYRHSIPLPPRPVQDACVRFLNATASKPCRELPVLPPPLDEQRRIVARIEQLAAKIQEARNLRQQSTDESDALIASSRSKLMETARHFSEQEFDRLVTQLRGSSGLPLRAYQQSGRFPVVDQGQQFIGGYSDDAALALHLPGPVVVWGDHTTNTKLVDFDFVPGADGTKVFLPKQEISPAFLYQFLKSVRFPDLGYSRHYRYLKRLPMPSPPLSEQRRIVAYLDDLQAKVDALKKLQAETAAELDALLPSILDRAFRGEL